MLSKSNISPFYSFLTKDLTFRIGVHCWRILSIMGLSGPPPEMLPQRGLDRILRESESVPFQFPFRWAYSNQEDTTTKRAYVYHQPIWYGKVNNVRLLPHPPQVQKSETLAMMMLHTLELTWLVEKVVDTSLENAGRR